MIREHGCEPPKSFDDESWIPYLYRLKMVKIIRNAVKEHRLQKATQEKYQKYGNTHSGTVSLHLQNTVGYDTEKPRSSTST